LDATHLFWQFRENQGTDSILEAELYYCRVTEILAFRCNVEAAQILVLFVQITMFLGKERKGTRLDNQL